MRDSLRLSDTRAWALVAENRHDTLYEVVRVSHVARVDMRTALSLLARLVRAEVRDLAPALDLALRS